MQTSPSPRILLVEDDLKLSALVKEYLESNGLEVQTETHGDRAVQRILREQHDLIVLDIMLPGKDGFQVCREVRPQFAGPILMLTARGSEIDEINGLELGADDYVAKPVQPRLLLSRIHALLRRMSKEEKHGEDAELRGGRIELGPLVIDFSNRSVRMEGHFVETTTAEFDLLWLLARHAGEILRRGRIYSELRGIDYDGIDRSIDLRIARLRKKLGDVGDRPRVIKSVRGVGYMLVKNP